MNKNIKYSIALLLMVIIGFGIYHFAIKSKPHSGDHQQTKTYTCPMPQDSFFSDQPGTCPKCGMTLVEVDAHKHDEDSQNMASYTCPMPEDSVFSDKPGICPKCGMTLIKTENHDQHTDDYTIDQLLKPTNQFVIGKYPVITAKDTAISGEINLPGVVAYDPAAAVNIAARISGRIEKMYINYKFQVVKKGQKLFDVYSPELLTEQQNFIFLNSDDPENTSIIEASKQKLLLYGMTQSQISSMAKSKTANARITIYSPVEGIISGTESMSERNESGMSFKNNNTEALGVKEGNYIKKGEVVFKLLSTDRVWGIFNVMQGNSAFIKINQPVLVTSEMNGMKPFTAKINYIETQFNPEDRSNSVRVYLNNKMLKLPIGLRLEGLVKISPVQGIWLDKKALVSTGTQKIIFTKKDGSFKAKAIKTGLEIGDFIQILSGISLKDELAQNAQYLMDSESFIKTK